MRKGKKTPRYYLGLLIFGGPVVVLLAAAWLIDLVAFTLGSVGRWVQDGKWRNPMNDMEMLW